MSSEAWIAFGGLLFVMFVQIGVSAFALGGLFQRVKAMEGRPENDCKAELAALTAKFEGLERTVGEMAHDIKNLLTGKVVPARRANG